MTVRQTFWLLVIGSACLLGFLAVMGSWDPAEAPATAAALAALLALWGLHAYSLHRHQREIARDPRMRRDRERRGF